MVFERVEQQWPGRQRASSTSEPAIYLALQSPDQRKRDAAIEFLEALNASLPAQGRELFRLIADDLEPADRLARASAYLPEPPGDETETLRRLLTDGDTSLATLAAYHVRALAHPELSAELDELEDQRPSLCLFGEGRAPEGQAPAAAEGDAP